MGGRARRAVVLITVAAVCAAGAAWQFLDSPHAAARSSTTTAVAPAAPGTVTASALVDPRTAWIVEQDNTNRSWLFETRDAGLHWRLALQNLPTSTAIFVFGTAVLVLSDNGLFRSDNGGSTWRRLHLPVMPLSTTFLDATHGFGFNALTSTTTLERTDDGGASWHAQSIFDGPFQVLVTTPMFTDADHGLLVANSADCRPQLVSTVDGGRNWTYRPITGAAPGRLQSAYEYEGTLSVVVVTPCPEPNTRTDLHIARVMVTKDGGNTWAAFDPSHPAISSSPATSSVPPLPPGSHELIRAFQPFDSRHFMVLTAPLIPDSGQTSQLATTWDGGAHWVFEPVPAVQ